MRAGPHVDPPGSARLRAGTVRANLRQAVPAPDRGTAHPASGQKRFMQATHIFPQRAAPTVAQAPAHGAGPALARRACGPRFRAGRKANGDSWTGGIYARVILVVEPKLPSHIVQALCNPTVKQVSKFFGMFV